MFLKELYFFINKAGPELQASDCVEANNGNLGEEHQPTAHRRKLLLNQSFPQ